MARGREVKLPGKSGKGKRISIVVSRFNEHVTKQLLAGALNYLKQSGVSESDIEVSWVPGAFEIPVAIKTCVAFRQPDALIALGCIVRGETSNYEHIAQAVTHQISQIAVSKQVPIGFGVLTVDSIDQAISRSGGKFGNKGTEAAESALEMTHLLSKFGKQDIEEQEKILKAAVEKWSKN